MVFLVLVFCVCLFFFGVCVWFRVVSCLFLVCCFLLVLVEFLLSTSFLSHINCEALQFWR